MGRGNVGGALKERLSGGRSICQRLFTKHQSRGLTIDQKQKQV